MCHLSVYHQPANQFPREHEKRRKQTPTCWPGVVGDEPNPHIRQEARCWGVSLGEWKRPPQSCQPTHMVIDIRKRGVGRWGAGVTLPCMYALIYRFGRCCAVNSDRKVLELDCLLPVSLSDPWRSIQAVTRTECDERFVLAQWIKTIVTKWSVVRGCYPLGMFSLLVSRVGR